MSDPTQFQTFSQILSTVAPPDRAKLEKHFGRDLTAPSRLQTAAARLSERDADAMRYLLALPPDLLRPDTIARPSLSALTQAGLVVRTRHEGKPLLAIPLEVRVACARVDVDPDPPLAVFLATWDEAELAELCSLHDIAQPEATDPGEIAIACADALNDAERLLDVFESLSPSAKRLLHWWTEVNARVSHDTLSHVAARFARMHDEPQGTCERVLDRLALLHEGLSEEASFHVPIDLRMAFADILEQSTYAAAESAWGRLRAEQLPSLRDAFPYGEGGNALVAARRVVAAALQGDVIACPLASVLQQTGVLDDANLPVDGIASAVLDVSSTDRFAQRCLRAWTMHASNRFSDALVVALGGDVLALRRIEPLGDQPAPFDVVDASMCAYRSTLLIALSSLQPGYWFRLSSFARFAAAAHRASLWPPEYEREDMHVEHVAARPRLASEWTSEDDERLHAALAELFRDLLVPVGAVALDPSGALFTVNGEALRVARDHDDLIPALAEFFDLTLGDDAGVWLPIPTDWGARVTGWAELRWTDDGHLVVPLDCHLFDLRTAATWGVLTAAPHAYCFRFTAQTVARGRAASDAGAFALWLHARTGAPAPEPLRSLLGDDATIDADWAADAREHVEELIGQLDEWTPAPPLSLLEELRGWGDVAVTHLVQDLVGVVDARRWTSRRLPHLVRLAGEFGHPTAIVPLLRVLVSGNNETAGRASAIALARIGPKAIDRLRALAEDPSADLDARMDAMSALSALAVLHPAFADVAVECLYKQMECSEDYPEDVPSILASLIAETGHPRAREIIDSAHAQGLLLEGQMSIEELIWVAETSPSEWGDPQFAASLAEVYGGQDGEETEPDYGDDDLPPARRRS